MALNDGSEAPVNRSVGDDIDALLLLYAGQLPLTAAAASVVEGRGRNQLLLKSKKHRSDQLQLVRKRMMRRMLQ